MWTGLSFYQRTKSCTSEFKEFENDKFIGAQVMVFIFERAGNIVENGENTGDQYLEVLKLGIVFERDDSLVHKHEF